MSGSVGAAAVEGFPLTQLTTAESPASSSLHLSQSPNPRKVSVNVLATRIIKSQTSFRSSASGSARTPTPTPSPAVESLQVVLPRPRNSVVALDVRRVSVASSAQYEIQVPEPTQVTIPTNGFYAAALAFFCAIPAVLWWYWMSWEINAAVSKVHERSQHSIDSVVYDFRSAIILNASRAFYAMSAPAEESLRYYSSRLKAVSFYTLLSVVLFSLWLLIRVCKHPLYVPREVVRLMVLGSKRKTSEGQSFSADSSNPIPPTLSSLEYATSTRLLDVDLATRRVVTIMFADIAGFSTLCENLSPEALMVVLSEYLDVVCQIIIGSKGTLDKFIGDCVVAFWNAPLKVEKHPLVACQVALEMQSELFGLWQDWERRELPKIKFRAGINTTEVLVGNLGCEYRINYTCVGSGVYLANQLEAVNKYFGTVTLVTESTHRVASAASQSGGGVYFRRVGVVQIPGQSSCITLYEPLYVMEPVVESGKSPETCSKGSGGKRSVISDSSEEFMVTSPQSVPNPTATSESTSTAGFRGKLCQLKAKLTPLRSRRTAPMPNPASPAMAGRLTKTGKSKSSGSFGEKQSSSVSSSLEGMAYLTTSHSVASSTLHYESDSLQPVVSQQAEDAVVYCWNITPKGALTEMALLYEKGLHEFTSQNFGVAEKFFSSASSAIPARDSVSAVLLKQIAKYGFSNITCTPTTATGGGRSSSPSRRLVYTAENSTSPKAHQQQQQQQPPPAGFLNITLTESQLLAAVKLEGNPTLPASPSPVVVMAPQPPPPPAGVGDVAGRDAAEADTTVSGSSTVAQVNKEGGGVPMVNPFDGVIRI